MVTCAPASFTHTDGYGACPLPSCMPRKASCQHSPLHRGTVLLTPFFSLLMSSRSRRSSLEPKWLEPCWILAQPAQSRVLCLSPCGPAHWLKALSLPKAPSLFQ